tara:strand:- start:651 stop:773 length:123 start_codon:yes stop_codon:yes gene_type:complete
MPAAYIDRIRREAFDILDDLTAPISRRQMAWRFLKQHGVK